MNLDSDKLLQNYFQSMMTLIENNRDPEQSLLELKFRELILTIADNSTNIELHDYFRTLLQEPQTVSLVRVMEDNFSFNLKLEDFAKLSARSLSAFKRDFQKQFNTTPGKWLLAKRLDYSMHLLSYERKTIADASFESGFENPSHFSRSFRKQFGFSPTSVKQKLTA
jgi:AraC family transcriptional regulator, exoenzyme S synthesis regulatory protein ExsA